MTMKKLMMVLFLVLALTFAAAGMADEVPAGLIGEWQLISIDGEAMEGANVVYIFTETEVSMKAPINDMPNVASAPYTVVGDAIVANEIPVSFVLAGDTLTLSDENQTMVFMRKGAEAPAADSIIGEWKLTELLGDDEDAENMQLVVAMGGVVKLTFTETEMILSMSLMGQTMEQPSLYTIGDGQIVTNGVGVPYTVEGDKLTISDGETGMVLVRVGSEADVEPVKTEPAVEPRRSDSIIGEWTLINITGNEEAEGLWQVLSAMGGTIDLTISENSAVVTMQAVGKSNVQTIDGHVVGNTVVDSNGETQFVLEDGLVKIYSDDGVVMVFQAK